MKEHCCGRSHSAVSNLLEGKLTESGPRDIETGERFSPVMDRHINAISQYSFMNILNMSSAEYHIFMSTVRREALDVRKKAYLPL